MSDTAIKTDIDVPADASEEELLRSLDQIVQTTSQGGELTVEGDASADADAAQDMAQGILAETSSPDWVAAPVAEQGAAPSFPAATAHHPDEEVAEVLAQSGSPEEWTALSAIGALDGDGLGQLEQWLNSAKPEEQEVYARRLRLGHVLLYALEQQAPPQGLRQTLANALGTQDGQAQKLYPQKRTTLTQRWAEKIGWPHARLLKVFSGIALVLAIAGWSMAWRGYQQMGLMAEAASRSEKNRHAAEEARLLGERRLAFLAGSDLRLTRLQAMPGQGQAAAHLIWSPFGRKALLYARDLPKAPEGREYSLWTVSGTRHFAAARFQIRGVPEGEFIDVPTLQEGRPRPIQSFSIVLQPAGARSPEDGERRLSGSTYH